MEIWFSKQESEWSRTAAIVAMIHNTKAKTPKSPDKFNPFSAPSNQIVLSAEDQGGSTLAAMFGAKKRV